MMNKRKKNGPITDVTPSKLPDGYIFQPTKKKEITPTRLWRFFHESDFENNFEVIGNGNFGVVKRGVFKSVEYLDGKKQLSTYGGQAVAIKDPKGTNHDFVEEQYALSHEVSCTVILHPNLVNYIGGIQFTTGEQRIGIVMELLSDNLRNKIKSDVKLKKIEIQLNIAKQIASGMNFLHSLNPHILHRDLRTSNILLSNTLDCKISDFGLSTNSVYEGFKSLALYTSLIPPECIFDQHNFTKAGDIYFYGWLLIELVTGEQIYSNNLNRLHELISKEKINKFFSKLILSCLDKNIAMRPSFNSIVQSLNEELKILYDLELIAQNNRMDLLEEGIRKGKITKYTCDSLGRNLIYQCCIFGNFKMLKYLINIWGDQCLKSKDKFNVTLSHIAGRNGYLDILNLLFEKRISTNEREGRFHVTPLDLSIAMKHTLCINFLISHANQDSLDSALQSSSYEGDLELVSKLITQGATIECRTPDIEATPLDRASYNGHAPVVEYLLKKGALVNQTRPDGTTSLYVAAQNGHTSVVEILLKNGADPNQVGDENYSPLYISCFHSRLEIAELLLKYGANVNKSNSTGFTSLYVSSERGNLSLVKLLVKYGAEVDLSQTASSSTALFIACQQGHLPVIEYLLDYGADINGCRSDMTTPLYAATEKGNVEIVKFLIKRGADVNKRRNSGTTPIFMAAQKGHTEVVRTLLENGADPNVARTTGGTPLTIASYCGHYEVVKDLLKYGADINAKDNGGDTALDNARIKQHSKIEQLLISHLAQSK